MGVAIGFQSGRGSGIANFKSFKPNIYLLGIKI
jgi:hypothetical protein